MAAHFALIRSHDLLESEAQELEHNNDLSQHDGLPSSAPVQGSWPRSRALTLGGAALLALGIVSVARLSSGSDVASGAIDEIVGLTDDCSAHVDQQSCEGDCKWGASGCAAPSEAIGGGDGANALYKQIAVIGGNCEQLGYETIVDQLECENAANYLQLVDRSPKLEAKLPRPQGCYVWNSNGSTPQLLFNTNTANNGNGVECNGACQPICSNAQTSSQEEDGASQPLTGAQDASGLPQQAGSAGP